MAGADRLVVVSQAAAMWERGENLIVPGQAELAGDTVVLRGRRRG